MNYVKSCLIITMLLGVQIGYSEGCYGDGTGTWNVLDIVTLANCVLSATSGNPCEDIWECDFNDDGSINILDIVILANCILAQNCD